MKSSSFLHRPGSATGARPNRVASLALACGLLFFAGCGSAPVVRFHTLMPQELTAPPTTREPSRVRAPIAVENVRVPAQVDQPQWLITLPDGTLRLLEQDRWAAPLADELREALLDRLTRRFGAVRQPQPARGERPWAIRVEVSRFEALPAEARLEAEWSISRRGNVPLELGCRFQARSAASGIAMLAEAHRRHVEALGDVIGRTLEILQQGGPASCIEP
jgi:uncharacterized lipoprotein YmbA